MSSLGNFDYIPTTSQLYSNTMSSTANGFTTITGIKCTKNCPILTEGVITREVMLAWDHACCCYCKINTITEDEIVAHIGASINELHLQDWFAAEQNRLIAVGLDNYLVAFTKHVLPHHWAHKIQEKILFMQ